MKKFFESSKKNISSLLVSGLLLMLMGGILFIASPALALPAPTNPIVYRLYNGIDHFYTTSQDEVDALSTAGSSYVEETGWSRIEGPVTIYRFYNGVDHFYTASQAEANYLTFVNSHGYYPEGVAWENDAVYGPVVYRYYNPYTGDHFYTTNEVEGLNALNRLNYRYEGIGWGGEIQPN